MSYHVVTFPHPLLENHENLTKLFHFCRDSSAVHIHRAHRGMHIRKGTIVKLDITQFTDYEANLSAWI